MSWERRRAAVEKLLADGALEQVAPSTEVADRLIADAQAHIALASKGIIDDPPARSSLPTTPAARHARPYSPSKAYAARPEAATSRSSTPCEPSSTTAAVSRSSVASTTYDAVATAANIPTSTPPASPPTTPAKPFRPPGPRLAPLANSSTADGWPASSEATCTIRQTWLPPDPGLGIGLLLVR